MATTEARQLYPAPFLQPFGERIAGLTTAEINRPLNIGDIAPDVAQISPLVQAAQQRTATQAGLGALQFDPNTGGVTGVGPGTGIAAYQPYVARAEQLSAPGAYQEFESPYQAEVISETQRLLDEQRAAGRQRLADQAYAVGAFGGGREGVQRAEYERQRDISDAGIIANLRQQGLQRAQQLQQQALQNQLGLAQSQGQLEGQITSQLGATGTGATAYDQAILDAQQQQALLGYEYPLSRLGQASNIAGTLFSGSPAISSPIQQFTQQPGLTGIQSLASLYGTFFPPDNNKK